MKVKLSELQESFPELSRLTPLGTYGGQKVILRAVYQDRPVVLKLIRPSRSQYARIEREITAVARLQSPHVPKILKHGWRTLAHTRVAVLYIIEPFIQGRNLREILRTCGSIGFIPALALADALVRVCMELERVHLVHRDIKPENIMIDVQGHIWLIDFGMVRVLDMSSLTGTDLFRGVGTLGYAAPEQFMNLKSMISVRSDLYAIGVVLYEAITGKNPFLAAWPNSVEIMRHMQQHALPPLDHPLDPDGMFSRWLQWLTQPNVMQRPESARDAYHVLTNIMARLDDFPRRARMHLRAMVL